jgi:tRNA(Ile)-lysidine synthase
MGGRSLLAVVRQELGGASDTPLVLGLSGGPDSVALLDVLVRLREEQPLRVVAAHLDHGLRVGSSADREFCEELCQLRGVELVCGRAPVRERAVRDGGGLEEAGRSERYAFLRQVKAETSAGFILVAHTRDDQAETVLMRLVRGSGSSGLAGMRARSGDLLRPFLEVSREEILEHLRTHGIPFREDPTNADPLFLRNRIRHELIPYLEHRFNPRIREGLARTASLLAEEDDLLVAEARARVAAPGADGVVRLSRKALLDAPAALARRMVRAALEEAGGLRGISSRHVESIRSLARSPFPSGRQLPLPGGRKAVFSFGEILLAASGEVTGPFLLPLPVPGRVVAPGGRTFTAVTHDGSPVSNLWEGVVTLREGEGLVVRSPRPGDRVRLGGRARKLRRVLMDRKVPREFRDAYPVVASGEEVLFVPGEKLDGPQGAGPLVRIAVAP